MIAMAIHSINPVLPDATVRDYAATVVEQADRHALDPWLIVEIVHRETHWIPTLPVRHEHDGSCSVGLGQINVPCGPQMAPLLEPHANLRRTASVLDKLRGHCMKDCGGLGWVRAYNPGSKVYGPAIVAAVKARHPEPR